MVFSDLLLSVVAGDSIIPAVVVLLAAIAFFNLIQRLVFSPLRSIPGPLLWRVTRLPGLYASWAGYEPSLYTAQFRAYNSPIIRIGPNEVLLADGSALAPIYVASGGMDKAECYSNFDIDGHPTIFSGVDKTHRSIWSRAVTGMFATRTIRERETALQDAIKDGVGRLLRERQHALVHGGSIDLLSACRAISLDMVTAYSFGSSYGGSSECAGELAVGAFVDAFVAVGRFFYLPSWVFVPLSTFSQWAFDPPEIARSFERVDKFVRDLVVASHDDDMTYQGRLLERGLSNDEVVAQCKDIIFAGVDTVGMNLTILCWNLARQPAIYDRLKDELRKAKSQSPSVDPATLPFFQGCVKEALRLSMANTARLPRVVPEGGWDYEPANDFTYIESTPSNKYSQRAYFLPAGTLVSVQMHTLHHNPAVFTDPFRFDPDRWSTASDTQLEKMNRDLIPFSVGSRQCIARNLAMTELYAAGAAIVEVGALGGASCVRDKIEIFEWFNARVKGKRVDVEFRKT